MTPDRESVTRDLVWLYERKTHPKMLAAGVFEYNLVTPVLVVRFGGPNSEGLAWRTEPNSERT